LFWNTSTGLELRDLSSITEDVKFIQVEIVLVTVVFDEKQECLMVHDNWSVFTSELLKTFHLDSFQWALLGIVVDN
jgi:hypothetical protein